MSRQNEPSQFCSSCGVHLPKASNFCPSCGTAIEAFNDSPVLDDDKNQLLPNAHSTNWIRRNAAWVVGTAIVVGIVLLAILFDGVASDSRTSTSSSTSTTTTTPRASATFTLSNVSTGWSLSGSGAQEMYMPYITFTVNNTGSVHIGSIKFTARFRTGSGTIMGSDKTKYVNSIPAGESRGSFSIRCSNGYRIYDGSWDQQLDYMSGYSSRAPVVELHASVDGGTTRLVDEFTIYVP